MSKQRSKAQLAADKRRTGRPPKKPADKLSQRVMIYLTPAEHKRLQALANKDGLSLASQIMRPWREEEE
ncbi:MAG: ribbon-helix-helix domain-containing protein [Candidatus Latescibacterota bacterium]|jgi:predicted HicB family RNase H-like nuclease